MTSKVFSAFRAGVLAAFLLGTFTLSAAWSQSTDFSRPTPLRSVPLIDEHDGSQNLSRFYTFYVGPGKILVTFDGHASKYSTNAQVKLWDANRNSLGEVYLVAGTSPSSETKQFTFAKRQRVILETSLKEDKDMGVLKFSVNVSGAVQLAPPTSTGTGTSTSSNSAGTSTGSVPSSPSTRSGDKRLLIELRDGSIREFDMSNIRRVVIE